MADEPTNNAPQTAPEVGDKQPNVEQDQEWAKIVNNKFKSPSDVAKAYLQLEEKLGEQSTEVAKAREVMDVMYPIMKEIQDDPELFKTLEKKLNKQSSPEKPAEDKADSKSESSIPDDVRSVTSDLILAKFEEKHGIDKLEPDAASKMRQEIGIAIKELTGTKLSGVDLRRLSSVLENAYIIAKYKSKSADSGEAEAEDRASISSIPAKAGKSETVLTPDEATVAQKMGLTREQYLEGKKSAGKVR